jgi:hypothetical protein
LHQKIIKIKEKSNLKKDMPKIKWVNAPYFELPRSSFIYNPTQFNPFAFQGEEMVLGTIEESKKWSEAFEKWFPYEVQEKVFNFVFQKNKKEWELANPELVASKKDGSRVGCKYYETNRKFTGLVPKQYNRTAAPRLSSKGSTFQGMKKDLLMEIIRLLSLTRKILIFIDIDMSACHSRIATALQPLPFDKTELYQLVHTPNFWATQVDPGIEGLKARGIEIDPKTLKKILKVFVYTAFNGGNPLSEGRLLDTLNKMWPEAVPGMSNSKLFGQTELFKDFTSVFGKSTLLQSIKDLNKTCSEDNLTFGIDRVKPYYLEKDYFGISRVFQSFEVVLMCKLAQQIVLAGGIPISLVHDGILCMFVGEEEEAEAKIAQMQPEISRWSKYLLRDIDMPLEAKWVIKNGIVVPK